MEKEDIHLSDGMIIKAEDIKDEGFIDELTTRTLVTSVVS